jgi:hypothetical protein
LSVRPDGILEEFRVAADGDALLLPVSFGGEEHLFLLDTGAEVTVCDVSLQDKLEKARKAGCGGLSLGKLSLDSWPSQQTMDLERFRKVSGHEIMGILGMDALRRFVVQVDLDAGKVRFLQTPGRAPGVPMRLETYPQEAPRVVAQVAGAGAEPFILDTGMIGYGSGALKAELFESLAGQGRLHPLTMSMDESAAGKSAQRNGRVEGLLLGDFNHRDLIFAKQKENLLGLNFLSRYVVTFDFPSRTVYLKKGNRFNAIDAQDRSGLHIVRIGERPVVDSVDPGSPAALAGVRAGDEILRLSDRDARGLTLFSIRKLLCHPGEEVRLTLQRGAQEIVLPVFLSKWEANPPLTTDPVRLCHPG